MHWNNFYTRQNKLISIHRSESTPAEPLTLTEVKTQLRITGTDNDTELTALITRGRQEYEERAIISIVLHEIIYTGDLSRFPFDPPYGPVVSYDEVLFKTGVSSLGVNEYDELIEDDWNTDDLFRFNSGRYGVHKITYTAGMGAYDDEDEWVLNVPAVIKERLLNIIAIRYRHRGDALNEQKIAEAINKIVEPDWIPCL